MENANLLSPEDKEKCKISPTLLGRQNAQSPLPWEQGKSTKLPTHLRQVRQLSLTHLFSAKSLGFSRSRVGKRALYLPKEQGELLSLTLLGRQNAQSPLPWKQGKNTKLPTHLRQAKQLSQLPLQREKHRFYRLQGRGACALPAQRARKSLHSSLSKGRELRAPGWGPFLVSPSSTCFKYFKSHSGHVCHFAELIYARLYLIVFITLHIYFFKKLFINKELLLLHCSWFI
ncbi:hypothetical protein T4A_8502 [Trichinella pseudospiralis]|uniref:Uncharacterized protein n=1 Tax=Trichinella pseudospiralis TaxID=6337 RepID=A0A0V1ECG5_TRIPS|nr:hypothetical protein T4A_8502 [Trichinella pseudospiralis]